MIYRKSLSKKATKAPLRSLRTGEFIEFYIHEFKYSDYDIKGPDGHPDDPRQFN